MDRLERDIRQTFEAYVEKQSLGAREQGAMLAMIRTQVASELAGGRVFQWRWLSVAMACVLTLFFVSAPWMQAPSMQGVAAPSSHGSAQMTPNMQLASPQQVASQALPSATPARPGPEVAPNPAMGVERQGTSVPALEDLGGSSSI